MSSGKWEKGEVKRLWRWRPLFLPLSGRAQDAQGRESWERRVVCDEGEELQEHQRRRDGTKIVDEIHAAVDSPIKSQAMTFHLGPPTATTQS